MYKQYQPPTPSFLVINFFPPSSLLSYPIDSAPDVSIQLSNLERKREDSSPESKRVPNEITKRNNLPKLAHESRIPLYSNSPPLLPSPWPADLFLGNVVLARKFNIFVRENDYPGR